MVIMKTERGNRGGRYEIEYDNCFFFFGCRIFPVKMLILACKYVTRPNYIVNSETKQKPETHDAR